MRFNQALHWSEGLFLQQHHLQYLQRFLQNRDRQERELMMAYPWGYFNVEIDFEALKNLRVVVKSVSAIFPGGEEISMPGNTKIQPFELKDVLEGVHEPFMVYLGLPRYSNVDGNLAETEKEKRMFSTEETQILDEYTGKSEITMIQDRLNVRITTSLQDNSDLDLLPLMRLRPAGNSITQTNIEFDRTYLPPFILLDDCPLLKDRIGELISLMKRRRDKLLSDLQVMGYTPDMFSGAVGNTVMFISTMNEYISRFSAYLNSGSLTPFNTYLELTAMAGKLSAFQPLRNWEQINDYNHEDFAPLFDELILWIRAMLLADGDEMFIRLVFTMDEENKCLQTTLSDDNLMLADEYFLAVSCHGNAREIVTAVEKGDNFRLISKKMAGRRIRGIRLTEMRYPPRYFPALADTVWFKVEKEDSSQHIWQQIYEDRAIVLDWAKTIFPDLVANLFITISEHGDKAK